MTVGARLVGKKKRGGGGKKEKLKHLGFPGRISNETCTDINDCGRPVRRGKKKQNKKTEWWRKGKN